MSVPVFDWGADLAELPGALWEGSGCAIVRGFPMDALGFEEMYLETASQLGEVVPQTVSGVMIYSVRDEGYSLERDFGQEGVRTSKTTSAFGFHTDSPSRMAGHTPEVRFIGDSDGAERRGIGVCGWAGGLSGFGRGASGLSGEAMPAVCGGPAGGVASGGSLLFAAAGVCLEPEFRVRYVRLYIEKGAELAGVLLTDFERAALRICMGGVRMRTTRSRSGSDIICGFGWSGKGRMMATKTSDIYQIKVTLLGSKPPIWRRLLVPASSTLEQLHRILQTAMGWENCHLHEFEIDKERYGAPDPDGGIWVVRKP